MTDPGFEWRSPEERAEELQRQDPLQLRAQPPSPLLLPQGPAPQLQAPVTPRLLERASAQTQRDLASPVLQAAGMERADAEQQAQERASTAARVAQLRGGLPENALEDAQARRQARQNPQAPAYFSTPAERRPVGSHPSAADWVGLYAYEMHVQQQLAGGRGIEGRKAADIQRRAVTGLGFTYGDYTEAGVAPEERDRDFGGHLAALGEAPFGAQVNHVILSRLPRGDRPGVQAAMLEAQQEGAALAQQDRRALDAQALESRLGRDEGPLSGRIPPGTPPEVQAQLRRGLNVGPGGFAEAGSNLPGVPNAAPTDGGTQVQVRSRREGVGTPTSDSANSGGATSGSTGPQGSATKAATGAPGGASDLGTKDKKVVAKKQAVQADEKTAKDEAKAKGKNSKTLGARSKVEAGKKVAAKKVSKGTKDGKEAQGKAKGASTGAAAPSAGGAGGGGPSALRAVPIAQVPKNLNAQPIMQLEGQALFDEAQWKKLTAPLEKAGPGKAPQATQPGRIPSGFTAPTPGVTAPRRAATPKKSPLSKLGHTISAAEIKQAEAKARKDAQTEMSGFVKRSQAKVGKLESAKKAIAPKVQGAAKNAQAKIAGAATTATGQVNAAAATATAKAQAAAAQARAKINAEFSSAVNAIKASTRSSQTALEAEHKAAVQTLTGGLTGLNTATRAEFTTAQGRARTIAGTEAGAASALGDQRAAAYAAEPLEHQSGWEDFTNGDDYPAKKREAKVQAAKSVGQGYHDELLKSGNDYADKLPEGAAKVEEGNQKLLDEHVKSLDQQLTQNLQALHQAETGAIQSATTAKGQQLAAVAQQLASALSGIAQQKGGLTGQISQQAASQKSAIGTAASSGVSGLQQAATTAISGLHKQISGIQGQLRGKGVPDAQALKVSLKGADTQIAGGVTAAQSSISGGAQQTAAGLTGQGTTSASGLLATARQGAQGISQAGTQAATGANEVATSASALFKNLAKGHENALKNLTSRAKQNTTAVQKSFTDNGKKVVDSVKDQLQKATDSFQGEMQKARSGEDAKITEEAEKAAAKVQPRWKGWVSIVIDIVIAVAVTALVIATGGVAGIVLGIVLGAVGGVLGQLAKDGLNGELSDWKTYAAAALGGAIGGALGAGGGALSGMLVKGLGTQMVKFGVREGIQTVAKVGVDFAANNVTGLVSQAVAGFVNSKAFGTPFDLSEVFSVKNMAQNALMTGVGMGAGKYFEHNPGVPNALRGMMNKVPGVSIKAPAPHVNTPETTGVGKPELNAGGSEVTGSKTNVNVEPSVAKPTGGKPTTETTTAGNPPEAAAGGGGAKGPPKPPSTRDAPPASEPPRPEGNNAQPRKSPPPGSGGEDPLAIPPTPESVTTSGGKGKPKVNTETEAVSTKPAETPGSTGPKPQPRLNEPPKGGSQESQGSQPTKRSGRETGEAGKPFEEQVQRETGGKSEIIGGREIDSVTDEALIQAKDVKTDNPENFLSKSTRKQIKETVRLAGEQNKRAEFHFKEEPHPDVVRYIEDRGGFVVSPGRPRPAPGTPPRTPVENPAPRPGSKPRKNTGGPEEGGPTLDDGVTAPVTPTKPKGPQGPESGAGEAPTNEGSQARGRSEEGTPPTDETPFKASDLQGRHRGDPFAFGKGPRAERAQAMVEEATRASNISDIKKYVDVVTYEEGSSYFTVDEHGNRILNVGSNAFGRTKVGQIHEIAHELVHAQQFQRAVLKHGGDLALARQEFLGAEFGSSRYALDEVVAERLSMRRVEKYLGEVSPQQKGVSTKYANQWREAINWSEVLNEQTQSGGGIPAKPRGGNTGEPTGVSPARTGLPETQGIDGPGLRNGPEEMAGVSEGTRPANPTARLNEPPVSSSDSAAQPGGRNPGGSEGIRPEGESVPGAQGADRPGLRDGREGVAGLREEARPESTNPDLNPTSVADLPGKVIGEHDYTTDGPLAPDKAATFVGQRYKVVELTEDLVVYRVGEMDKPLGQFFDTQKPMSEIQSRIDKAVLPQWPGGGASPIDAVHAVRVPKGTQVYVGEVANQGGYYMGGTRQVVVLKPWEISGLEVVSSEPINRIQVKPAIPAETVGGVQAITPRIESPPVEGPPGTGAPAGESPSVQPRLHQTPSEGQPSPGTTTDPFSRSPSSVKETGELTQGLRAKLPQVAEGTAAKPSRLPPERLSEQPLQLQELPDAFREVPAFESGQMDSWEELGSGGNKDVYGVSDKHALAVLKPGKKAEGLVEELDMLTQLQELGLPTVRGELTLVDKYPAMLLERFSEGSKSVVKLDRGKVRIVGDSKLLSERSVRDLQRIKQRMQEGKIKIDDLQFLIGEDGAVVIADPLAIHLEEKPSNNNLRMIDLLIQQAQKNMDQNK